MQRVRCLLRPASSEPSDRGKFAQKRHCNPVTSSDDVPLRMRTVLHTSEASHFFSSSLEGERWRERRAGRGAWKGLSYVPHRGKTLESKD